MLNAIMSARFCCPGIKISIFDDLSDDRETLEIIERLSSQLGVQILRPEFEAAGVRGGLHRNIKTFIGRDATEEIAVLMQDDTQFFRALDSTDDQLIASYFLKKPESVFLYPMIDRHQFNNQNFEFCGRTTAWRRLAGSAYSGHSDVCLVHVQRARANLDVFGESEEQTSSRAMQLCGRIADLSYRAIDQSWGTKQGET